MSLTTSQIATLKASIIADNKLTVQKANHDTQAIADYLNGLSSFIVWKTSVNSEDIMRNGIDWTRVDNLSVGKARVWDWMSRLGSFDPSKTNIRAGIDAVWVGTAPDLAVRAYVYTQCKRAASWFEKIFSTGTGTDAVPGFLTVEGSITEFEIRMLAWSDQGVWLL